MLLIGTMLPTRADAAFAVPAARPAAVPPVDAMWICNRDGCRHMYKPYHARPYQQRYVNGR